MPEYRKVQGESETKVLGGLADCVCEHCPHRIVSDCFVEECRCCFLDELSSA